MAVCLVAPFATTNIWAQATVAVTGVVADSTGAVISDATVKITNTDTNVVRTTTSSETGAYIFPALGIGPYRLEVTKAGFQTSVQSGIILQVGSNPAVNVTMQIGAASEKIEVHADAAMVETQSNGVGQVIQPEQIIDLPLNGRQATQLIALAGAAVQLSSTSVNSPATSLNSNLDYPTSVSFSVAGSQGNATNYLLDGSTNMDYRTNIGSPFPFPDALEEFKVEASAVPANSGNHPGGTVSGITKAGTNNIHGNVFEFLRNGIMDAKPYAFPVTSPVTVQDNLRRNTFGGTVGGPIVKNKVFGFYGFQEQTERLQQAPTARIVPTAAMLAGDFTTFLSTPCQSSQQYLNQTVPSPVSGGAAQQLTTSFHSNILTPNWLNTPAAQIAAKLSKLFPAPTNGCGNVSTSGYQSDNEYQHVARVDWNRTQSDTIFGRYFIANYSLKSSLQNPANILSTSGDGLADRVQNVSIGDDHTISPTLLSQFRLTFQRTASQRTGNPAIPTICSLGMLATCPVSQTIDVLFNVPGFLGYDMENAFGGSENINWLLGKHNLNVGFTYEYVQMNGDGTFQLNPVPAFSSGAASYTNNSYADFITGNVDSYGQGNGQLSRDGQNIPAIYAQDNWKITRNLTINAGLRWDPFYPQHNKYSQASDFNEANYNAGVFSTKYPGAPPGVTYPGDPGFNGNSNTHNRANQFGPRLGFIYDPFGDGKTTIRAAYGLYYDSSLMWNAMHVVLNGPWGNTLSFVPQPVNAQSTSATAGGGLANPFFGIAGGNPFPTPLNPTSSYVFPNNGAFVFQQSDIKPGNSSQWNLSVQRQVGANWLASVSYIGNKTSHVWLGVNMDPSVIITAGMTAPGIVSTTGMTGTSGPCTLNYNSQLVTFPTCNSSGSVSVNGVNNESARRKYNLANPAQGYKMNGGVLEAQSFGDASYNGMLASVQHRLSQGFSINANYTYSHCLNDGELGQDIAASAQNPANQKAEWANCSYDHRQVLNLSLVGQTPKFENRLVRMLASYWSASGIFTATTGSFNTVVSGSDVSLIGSSGVPGSGGGNDRPNTVANPFVGGSVAGKTGCPANTKQLLNWFNTCSFTNAAPGNFGNTRRNSLIGPGRWNFDAAVWRSFPIHEQIKFDFRAEAFNAFNHPQFGNPAVSLATTSTFGRITTTVSQPRILQVAGKIVF